MKRLWLGMGLCVAAVMSGSGLVRADTRAPSTQTFVLECDGATVTIVSPTFSAAAAQVVGSTGVSILQRVTSNGTVLYEHPSFGGLQSSAARLTVCTFPLGGGESLTLHVLNTPQGRR